MYLVLVLPTPFENQTFCDVQFLFYLNIIYCYQSRLGTYTRIKITGINLGVIVRVL